MPQSLVVRDGVIRGTHSGNQVPTGNVEVDDATLAAYQSALAQLRNARRNDLPEWDGTQVVVPADTRPVFGVSVNRASEAQVSAVPVLADGVDEVVVTVTAYEADGVTVRTGLNGVRYYEAEDDAFWRMTFVSGVATHTFKTTTLGRRRLMSNPRIRLLADVDILAHE